MSEDSYEDSYEAGYETDSGDDDQVQLKPITREVSGKKVTERVSPAFSFALSAGRQDVLSDKLLPPYLSVHDSKLNFKSQIDGSTALHIAAEQGKSNLVNQLLKAGITKNSKDSNGNTALLRGVIAGRTNACVYLARKVKKSGIDIQNDLGDSPIYVACRRNNTKLLEKLVKYGGNVNAHNNKGITPLMVACFYLNIENMDILIKAGASLDAYDGDHSNCLHYMAKAKGLAKVTKFGPFFDYFRKSVKLAESADVSGNQPLYYALQSKCEPLVNFLLNVTSLKDVRLVYNETSSPLPVEAEQTEVKVVEIDKKTDEYGYVQETIEAPQVPEVVKKINVEDKEKKWTVMLDEWVKTSKTPRYLFRRVYKFIPINQRKRYWEIELKVESSETESPGYFNRIVENQERGHDDDQIHKDVIRAHQNNVHFMTKFADGQRTLFRVLRAWSMQDKEVGYVQGFSDLCGFLILVMQKEEDVYWGFNTIMNDPKYNLRQMCLPDFVGIKKCAFVSMKVMKKYHSKIFYHLKEIDYDFENWQTFMFEYFMLWFCRKFPVELEVRVLDIIFLEGWEIVFSFFSTILHFSKEAIMKLDNPDFVNKGLAEPMELMGKNYDERRFFEFLKKGRITPKEIRKWFAIASPK
ncbi:growth hormone-regulated TBC protein, putative [Entamoeba invadens IP1]|uniref:Growth hormone-regulated TBC protein, putative n=1 Tax=Entamoeba invadens IP1 TaxID=370355 RepID=L7FKG8_ENTIV|nr:growth hormone-regulated TBC protein, putative [Entamoeba invadens IP1]ELP84809.1 growth hormone-regulated TBC protein, putative [Entamoeba invadens IP1]|eukprot:XP_004184155.1 growth hormone-regulated TBC protein, putative [Entamoeba invadens IP1]